MSRMSRYREVIRTFAHYGFADLVSTRSYSKIFRRKKVLNQADKRTRAERIRMLLQELGPTYVKLGQLLSNRRDLLPPELISELERLQDDVEPIELGELEKVLETELAEEREKLFRHIDKEPLASASIAQVHRAELYNGDRVVLKIQRPEIRKTIREDFRIIRDVTKLLLRNFKDLQRYQPFRLIDSIEQAVLEELNFKREAINLKRFREDFEEDPRLYVPRVYQELSTLKVLCMEEVAGVKISNIEELKRKHGDKFDELASIGTDLYFRQVFEHGFFHADPHPGNLFVLANGKLCFLDFGQMGVFLPDEQDDLAELLINMSRKNVKLISHTIQKMAINASIPNERSFERDLHDMLEMFATVSLKEIPLSDRIQRFRKILTDNTIELSANYYQLMRALVMLEGVAEKLDQDFDVFSNLNHYAQELLLKRYHPKRMARKGFEMLESGALFLSDLPSDAKSIVKKMKEGSFQIEFRHRNLEQLYKTFDLISNRMSVAILVASLIIGSSLLVLANIPPYIFNEIPVVGFIGFVLSGLLALWLIVSILRHNKL